MSSRSLWMVAPMAAILAAGCGKSEDDEYEPAVVPKAVSFEGKTDSKYAGVWKTSDGSSTLDLAESGGLKIETTVNSQNGKSTSKVEGKWLASGAKLLFQYNDTTLEYTAVLEGGKLVLAKPGSRMKSTYLKK